MDVQFSYRNAKLGDSSSSENDSDSNDDSDVWKRHTSKTTTNDDQRAATDDQLPSSSASAPMLVSEGAIGNSRKRKVNNIWSSVLEEESVVSDLCQIGLKAKLPDTQNRSCESYDFTLKYSDPRRAQEMETDSSANDTPEDAALSDDTKERRPFKKPKRYRSSESLDSYVKQNRFHDSYKWSQEDKKRYPRLSPADVEVARKIVNALGEKKYYLIYRVVNAIGADKAMQLLKMTEEVEENGGMLIKNNSRRRTPGGVYFQLMKSDKNITEEQVKEVFAHEIPFDKVIEYRKMKNKLMKKGKKKKKKNKSKNKNTEESMVCDEAAPNVKVDAEAPVIFTVQPLPSLPETCEPSLISASPNGSSNPKIELVDSDIEDGEILDN